MDRKDRQIVEAFHTLQNQSLPTKEQKEMMLNRIMVECECHNASFVQRLTGFVSAYPWRIAFAASAVQCVILTLIFGTRYTNLFLGMLGG